MTPLQGSCRWTLMVRWILLLTLACQATVTFAQQLICEDIAGEEYCERYRTLPPDVIEAEIEEFRAVMARKSTDEGFVTKIQAWQNTEAYGQLIRASDGETFSAACNESLEALFEIFDEPGRRRELLSNGDCFYGCLNLAIRATAYCIAFIAGALFLGAIVFLFIPIIGPIGIGLAVAFMAAVCGTSGVGVAAICNIICK